MSSPSSQVKLNKGKQRQLDPHPQVVTNQETFLSASTSSSSSSFKSSLNALSIPQILPANSTSFISASRRARRRSTKNRSLLLSSIIATVALPHSIGAINVTLPTDGYVQCANAVTYFTATGQVVVDVRYSELRLVLPSRQEPPLSSESDVVVMLKGIRVNGMTVGFYFNGVRINSRHRVGREGKWQRTTAGFQPFWPPGITVKVRQNGIFK